MKGFLVASSLDFHVKKLDNTNSESVRIQAN